jgi:citrate lyase subunit beta/citryl-CoA lyase
MRYRSWLYVPGDSERKLGKALATGADVVVVDLEASVPADRKLAARAIGSEWLIAHRPQILGQERLSRWVRINTLESGMWRDDLVAVLPGAPDGIILPKAVGTEAVRQLAAELYELEQIHRLIAGSTKILPVVGETARAALTIVSYAEAAMPRLAGLAWTTEGLTPAINATRHYDQKGSWSDSFRFVRAQTLLTAHACGIMALEAMHSDGDDIKSLKAAARAARADGFTGMVANHPAQIAEINAAFATSESELLQAHQAIAGYEHSVDEEVTPSDRRGIDMPQLTIAKPMMGKPNQATPMLPNQILGRGNSRNAELTPMRVLRTT